MVDSMDITWEVTVDSIQDICTRSKEEKRVVM